MIDAHSNSHSAGPTGVVEEVFANYHGELHRFLTRRLKDQQEAADLMQEVFLRLLRAERSELVREPQAYIYGIASHVVYEFQMRLKKQRVMYDSPALEALANDERVAQPDETAAELDTARRVQQALEQLSPMRLAVFLLSVRDGLSRDQISAKLHLSAHTVKKYLFQAMAHVGAAIED